MQSPLVTCVRFHSLYFFNDQFATEVNVFVAFEHLSLEFQEAVAELFFIPSDETVIEQKHATTTKAGTHVSRFHPVAFSLSNRLPGLSDELIQSPRNFQQLCTHLDHARSWKTLSALLGIQDHPSIVGGCRVAASGHARLGRLNYVCLRKLLYFADVGSQF